MLTEIEGTYNEVYLLGIEAGNIFHASAECLLCLGEAVSAHVVVH